ncbi:MAG: Nramp family divalent metal transporter [Candidatus Adlerbacteria bacterium]|nr:Nramp family divalent metal transporter [Candidatus Adlerbacteria bacterium]
MTHRNLLAAKGWGGAEGDGKESHRSVSVPTGGHWLWKLLAFSGPGYLVAVGYMDPGNWATDLVGGSAFAYKLLSVILLSNLAAVLFQHLCAKLGIATGRDLAQLCRDHFPKPAVIFLWVMAQVMIVACDLAEVIGSAIALLLLFHIPLMWGVLITGADVLLLLMLQRFGFRWLEAVVIVLIATIGVCFAIDVAWAHPAFAQLFVGFIPSSDIIFNKEMLYVAIGIIGATVMPHNLYLHSSLVQTRNYQETEEGKKEAVFYTSLDSTIALSLAFFVNAAILIVAAAAFNAHGLTEVSDLQSAYRLLAPVLGGTLAAVLFALALLASGQNSTITGTLAGQIIMEGFLDLRLPAWLTRMLTRGLALIPALLVVVWFGGNSLTQLLILSQVVLSVQLPFALFPLIYFTSQKRIMGTFVNPLWVTVLASVVAGIITVLNCWLVWAVITS